MSALSVALTGNPNTGKSTIFNELTGARQKIGNWPGVTIDKKVGVVVQTTQMLRTLNPIVEYLTSISKELHIANTICQSTAMRQAEAKELATESDLMIVVGSKKSANTTHLAEILKNITSTIHIENDGEINEYKDLISKANKISITAGASTPQNIIEKVVKNISEDV